jgi:hypothetical protein
MNKFARKLGDRNDTWAKVDELEAELAIHGGYWYRM